MKNIKAYVFGSKSFTKILKELYFFQDVIYKQDINFERKNTLLIIFLDKITKELLKNLSNLLLPTILMSSTSFRDNTKYKINNFSVVLKTPVEIDNFFEISKIIFSKFFFFNNSSVKINSYTLNANQKVIEKNSISLRLTEIEVRFLIYISKNRLVTKNDILVNVWKQNREVESHAFETCLHRLRKKIYNKFDDKNFIKYKADKYFL